MPSMFPWKHLDTALVPGSTVPLYLYQYNERFTIQIGSTELMSSHCHGSEDGFSALGCARISNRRAARVLIGGLGMGYTVRSALDNLRADAQVTVVELVPEVAAWNRELLGHLAGAPLLDPRVTLIEADVAKFLRETSDDFDLILLDVDNGPEGLTQESNDWLYERDGLSAAKAALRPRGVLGYWSSGPDRAFGRRLEHMGFDVQDITLRAADGRGTKHTIWLATVK